MLKRLSLFHFIFLHPLPNISFWFFDFLYVLSLQNLYLENTFELMCLLQFIIAKIWENYECPIIYNWIRNDGAITQWNTTWLWEKLKSCKCLLHDYFWKVSWSINLVRKRGMTQNDIIDICDLNRHSRWIINIQSNSRRGHWTVEGSKYIGGGWRNRISFARNPTFNGMVNKGNFEKLMH